MKIDFQESTTRPFLSLALGATALLFGTSCVAQKKYDEALSEVRYYQRQYQDLESFQGKLEAENERLKGDLALYEGTVPIEAAMTADLDARLEEFERMVAGIGATPGDVTVLSVEGGYGLRLDDAVLFNSGSTEILEGGRTVLASMAEQIGARPYARIWVRGHTDGDPVSRPETKKRFPKGNLELSVERALEVAAFLAAQEGIDEKLVVVAGFGPNDPVALNDSVDNKRKNRRVEIFVIEDEAAAQGK